MYKFLMLIFIWLIICGRSPELIQAQSVDEIYHKFSKGYHNHDNITLPYHLFVPENYDGQQKYPLVLCLHGAGERGDDSLAVKKNSMATVWARDSIQTRWPSFILVPQCPGNWSWMSADILLTVHDLLDSLLFEFSIDTNRIYITGLSMGGYGTWGYIAYYPRRYAAAVPVCGGGDTLQAAAIKHVPLWAFHGALDGTVPVINSRNMIRALEKEGIPAVYTDCHNGDCSGMSDSLIAAEVEQGAKLLYTEYESGGHSIWDQAYNDPLLIPWVFAQTKVNQSGGISEDRVDQNPAGFSLAQNYPTPFNTSTNIQISISKPVNVTLEVYNISGQKVMTLLKNKHLTGSYSVHFNGSDLAGGVYFYRLQSGHYFETKKLILLR